MTPTGTRAPARRSSIFGADGWIESAPLRLLDLVVAVHSDDAALVALVDELYAPTRTDAPAAHGLFLGSARVDGADGWFAASGAGTLVRTPAPGVAFRHLVFHANQVAIATATAPVRLHAAAVAHDGRAVALVGAMGAGKSTLAASLVTRGWDYLTDEVVALDPDGRVRPYAKPVSLGDPPASLRVPAWSPPPDGARYLGTSGLIPAPVLGSVASGPVALAAVVLPRYRPGAPVSFETLDPADALVEVGAHAFGGDAPGALPALAAGLAGVPCVRIDAGDLDAAGDAVASVVGT